MEGIKRLEEMITGQKDRYLIMIVDYLKQQIDMDKDFQKEEKNLKEMAEYIRNNARKKATGNVAVIEDAVVYQWAKDYFSKSNDELGISPTKKVEKKIMKDVNKEENDIFGSIFGSAETIIDKEQKENIEQISLFAA